jgi:hypothetical protein
MKEVSSEAERECRQALSLMEDALSILDRSDCALDVAAHLDLAICRLREALDFPAPMNLDEPDRLAFDSVADRGPRFARPRRSSPLNLKPA